MLTASLQPKTYPVNQQFLEKFSQVVTRYDFDGYECVNELLTAQMAADISDHALFKSIAWADALLVKLHSAAPEDLSKHLTFLKLKPQYIYLICLLMSAKMTDRSYTGLSCYLNLCQRISDSLPNRETKFFE